MDIDMSHYIIFLIVLTHAHTNHILTIMKEIELVYDTNLVWLPTTDTYGPRKLLCMHNP